MMTFEFDNLTVRTDKGKAIPELVHDYCPLPDHPEVIFKCTYLKNGESDKYLDTTKDGEFRYRFSDIFKEKVLNIKGMGARPSRNAEPIEIKTADDFLNWPQTGDMNSLMMNVALHIMSGSKLNEDEVKNFN